MEDKNYTYEKRLEEVCPVKVFLVSLILLMLTAALFFMVSSQEEIEALVYVPMPIDEDEQPNRYDFYIMNIHTGEIIFEADSDVYECPFGLSPDGQVLVYGIGETGDDFDYRILDIRTNNEISEAFTDIKPKKIYWLPDSSGFVFTARSHELGEPVTIYQYDIQSRGLSTLASIEGYPYPQIHRAGDTLVYIRHNSEQDILSIHQFDGQSMSFKIPDYASTYPVTFSNDGRFVSFLSTKSTYEHRDIYILDTSNGDIRVIEEATASFFGAWKPNSSQFIYHDGRSNYVLLDAITGETTSFQRGSSGGELQLAHWSLDARFLVMEYYTGALGEGYQNEIYVYDMESGDIWRADHYEAAFYSVAPSWSGFLRWISPHEFIYIHTDIGGSVPVGEENSDIFRYDVLTQTKSNLSNTPSIEELWDCPW